MSEFRIQAIDRFRGLSIIYMIFGHTIIFWVHPDDQWLRFFVFVTFEVIGANLFILLAGVSLVFSFHSQQHKLNNDENYSKTHARLQFFIPIIWLSGIAMGMNIIGSMVLGHFSIWIWNVLLTIAIARLLCYPLLRYSPWYRVVIGAIFFILTDPLRILLSIQSPLSHFLLFASSFDIVLQVQPFPFFGFLFIGSAIGDWFNIWRSRSKENNNLLPSKEFPRNLIIIGAILIIIGILTGLNRSSYGIAYNLFTNLGIFFDLLINGLPIFLIRGTAPWSIYSLGIQLIILALFLQFDIWRLSKQRIGYINKDQLLPDKFPSIQGLILFGQTSLTLYLIHNLVYFMFDNSLSIQIYFIWVSIVIFGIYLGIWFWVNRARMVGTLEWFIQFSTRNAIRKISEN